MLYVFVEADAVAAPEVSSMTQVRVILSMTQAGMCGAARDEAPLLKGRGSAGRRRPLTLLTVVVVGSSDSHF